MSVVAICAEAGIGEADFENFYASEAALFTAISDGLVKGHTTVITATMVRRRSLTESMRIALLAWWSLVEERADAHLATNYWLMSSLRDSVNGSGNAAISLHAGYLRWTEERLSEMAEIHGITWELPVSRLARLLLAALNGLVDDYLINRDSVASKDVLELLAYHIAQHGRRIAKNDPR